MIEKSAVKILVIDDEPFILKLQELTLNNLGYTDVITCNSALRALDVIDAAGSQPDLILLDLNMPDMDGVEFMRSLVSRAYAGSLILLSGEDYRVLQTAYKLGQAHQITVLGHMPKPIKLVELGNLLREWQPRAKRRLPREKKCTPRMKYVRRSRTGKLSTIISLSSRSRPVRSLAWKRWPAGCTL